MGTYSGAIAGIFFSAELDCWGAAAVMAVYGVGFAGLEVWEAEIGLSGVVSNFLCVDGVAGVAVSFLVAPLFVALTWSISSSLPSLSRFTTGIVVLAPAFSDAFDFELVVKSINLGLTRVGEAVPDVNVEWVHETATARRRVIVKLEAVDALH